MRRLAPLLALLAAASLPRLAAAQQAPLRAAVPPSITAPFPQSGALIEAAGIPPLRREVAVRYGAAPRALRAAWSAFTADTGDLTSQRWNALWDTATRRPLRIFGSFVPAPGTSASAPAAEKHARDFLARHAALLLAGNSIDDFDLVANDDDAGLRTVAFQQTLRVGDLRVPVVGGRVNLRYKADRLFMLGAEALPTATLDAPLTAPVSGRAAALSYLAPAQPTASVLHHTLVALPLVRARGVELVLAWQIATESHSPESLTDVFVNARDASIIASHENLRFLTGALKYEAPLRGPQEHALFPAENAHLLVGDTPDVTDKAGLFSIEPPADGLTCFARSNTIDVVNGEGDPASLAVTPPDGSDVVWSLKDDEKGDAQLSAFVHASIAKDYARKISPTLNFLNEKLQVKVNQSDSQYVCNAFWNGVSLNFFVAFQECNNTARVADVVYHEFGHAFHTNTILASVGAFDAALAEGGADYFASIVTGDPYLAPGFYKSGDYLREFDSDRRWPEDISFDPHETGLIFAGAMWDLRTILTEELGPDEGPALAHQLYRGALRRAPNIPSTFAEILATDDDDGDLGNGTPHICEILQAFAPHGITPYLSASGLALVHEPVRHLEAQTDTYPFKVSLTHAFPQCGAAKDDVDSLAIEWRTQGTAGKVPMSKDANGDYVGNVPGLPTGTQLRYKVIATVAGGESQLPQNPADDEYRAFIGDVTPLYCTDFEAGADDWTLGESNGKSTDFAWGEPHGAAGDSPAAYGGKFVLGTNLGTEGHYRSNRQSFADGPVIDLGEHKHVRLEFMRWLTVEDGYFDHANVMVNGQLVWTNKGTDEQDGSLTHQDLEWRFEDIDISNFTAGGIHTAQVRFELQSDDYGDFGGWNIDDVCVVAWEPTPPGESTGGSGGGGSGGGGSGGGGTDESGSGCACRTGSPTPDGDAPWALFGAAAALGVLVRRRK